MILLRSGVGVVIWLNTSQQVGGALGTALLNTVAVTASASYLSAHEALGRGADAGAPAQAEGYAP